MSPFIHLHIMIVVIGVVTRVVCTFQGEPVTVTSTSAVKKSHPYLYFSRDDILRLRDQVRRGGSHAFLYAKLSQVVEKFKDPRVTRMDVPPVAWQEFTKKWNEVYGNNLSLLAIYCALTPHDLAAHELAAMFMDRMASYPSWLVRGKEGDAVPVAHSLLGFTTAFDLLYGSFTDKQCAQYLRKLYETGQLFYNISLKRSDWGSFYIHNHVATNYGALLACAIAIQPHYPNEAALWTRHAVGALNKTLDYLKLVVDGSLNEGVSYGTYTMRSLVQFIFLTKRHMGYSYHGNNWLHEHFNFLLHSVFPGFQRTFGIADSVQDWAYAPEGILMFLENYVIAKGSPLWLGSLISKHRTTRRRNDMLLKGHNSIFIEFLFYNESTKEIPASHAKLHVFSDFGVITYGGGRPAGEVFLSFKCSRLHGRAINTLRPKLKKRVQNGFKPGHEHPDQGSFVFITKEQAVVTESFYAPKFTFMENTLMFGPGRKSSCSGPCVGQDGEGSMWLNPRGNRTWQAHAELVGYSMQGEIVFTSGDMTGWYDRSLGLDMVYRTLVMLSSSVLVVIDTVRLQASSPTTHVGTFFHNVDVPFEMAKKPAGNSLPCARIGLYSMCWAHGNSRTVNIGTKRNYRMKNTKYPINFINITWELLDSSSSTAYVFHGPNDVLHDVKVLPTSRADGINISLQINGTDYSIVLCTRYSNPRLRRKLLDSNGYGKLYINRSTVIDLGVKGTETKKRSSFSDRNVYLTIKVDRFAFFYAPLGSLLVLVGLFIESARRAWSFRCIRWTMCVLFVVGVLTLVAHFRVNPTIFEPTSSYPTSFITDSDDRDKKQSHPDAVIMTGIPMSGVEIARELFTMNTDFLVIGVPSEDVIPPSNSMIFNQTLDFRQWKSAPKMTNNTASMDTEKRAFKKWWTKTTKTPTLVKKNQHKEKVSLSDPLDPGNTYWIDVTKSRGALAMVHFKNPGWLFRMNWLDSEFPGNSFTPMLYVVRDPRSWIEHLLSRDVLRNQFLKNLGNALKEDLEGIEFSGISSFQEIHHVDMPVHIVLAHVWKTFTSHALRLGNCLPSERFQIVRFEDLVSSPKQTGREVFQFLRMPFSAAVEHRILLVVKSGVFNLQNYGIIHKEHASWGKILTKQQVLEIEQICMKTMIKIGYH